jgi:hypothetical protein
MAAAYQAMKAKINIVAYHINVEMKENVKISASNIIISGNNHRRSVASGGIWRRKRREGGAS